MTILDKKLVRDLARLWPQALAIALVMAAGVATLILAVGAYRSLDETRAAYYERNRFADIFASVKRAPKLVEARIAQIPGVLAAETRILKSALLDIEGFAQPATALVLSLPDHRSARLNTPHVRIGRLPEPDRTSEVAVNEAFATAHGFGIGSRFHAILNGKKYQLVIVGIALSPEFIYAIGPGDLMPDDRRFAVLWMSERALAGIFDLEGAFSAVSLKLQRGASEAAVIADLDALLARYGGTGAEARKDQLSHAFLDAELEQLYAMARIIPPIFLFVSAFLINMTLARLIALEREQIGLLKAVGYGRLGDRRSLPQARPRHQRRRHPDRLRARHVARAWAHAALCPVLPLPLPDLRARHRHLPGLGRPLVRRRGARGAEIGAGRPPAGAGGRHAGAGPGAVSLPRDRAYRPHQPRVAAHPDVAAPSRALAGPRRPHHAGAGAVGRAASSSRCSRSIRSST